MFEIIFLIAAGVYFLALTYISIGLMNDLPAKNNNPSVSVIIAARNEEENIAECLASLENQDYSNYEVIVADDFSTDRTGEIIDSFVSKNNCFRKIVPEENSTLTGKANALDSAIDASLGEILLFTDADCVVPSTWIRSVVSYYTADTGMVNGFSVTNAEGVLSGIESTDLVFLVAVAAGMANKGHPVSCIGNNMSVAKGVYLETGGYKSIPVSVTEDYALLNKIHSLNKYEISFPLDAGTVIMTKAHTSFMDLIQQKKRWALGGLASVNKSIILMVISYLVNLLFVLSFFFYSPQVLLIIIFKLFSEFLFLYQVHDKLGIQNNIKYFPFFEIYYILYTITLPVLILLNRKVVWKGRTY
jgi:cellulose synthase/poly-beta-1,6-N-acetylglucosamine synthase-like glycosyltransferase